MTGREGTDCSSRTKVRTPSLKGMVRSRVHYRSTRLWYSISTFFVSRLCKLSAISTGLPDGWTAVCHLSPSPLEQFDMKLGLCPSYRWLKFEEDVEDGGERWSKPYVATLSLHSLFELRSCILTGIVLLDMRASSVEEVAGIVQ